MRSRGEWSRDLRMYASRALNRSLAPPDRVSVNLTLRCNLACTMCTTCYDSPELSTEEVYGIIDQTADWGVTVFNPLGGEPFMRADLEDILAYAVQRGFYVTVTTNGTLITEKRAARLAALPPDRLHFNVSLDGDAETHDPIRGAGMWQRAVDGVLRLRDADARAGNSRRKVLANTILHARNAARFGDILDGQAALGFDGVQVLNLFRAGPDVPKEAAGLWFSPEGLPVLHAAVDALRARRAAQGAAGYRIQNTDDELALIPRYYTEALQPLDAPCWAGWKELYINADGAAIMCDGQLDFLAGTFGNVRQQTLRQLWSSPALRARRVVVKSCRTPCVQTCYLRGSSDSGAALAADAVRIGAHAVAQRARALDPRVETAADTVLRLELTDVCPCDAEACPTPPGRWAALTRGLPERPHAANWARLRDARALDFGRGFLGLELARGLVADLAAARLRVGTLALRWRGEPLLHPEIEPLLRLFFAEMAAGRLAARLRVETDGRFLTPGLAALALRGPGAAIPQDWVLDLRRGDGAGLGLLRAHRGPAHRIVLVADAVPGLDAAALVRAHPGFPVHAGPFPAGPGDALWLRRTDHADFRANAAARAALEAAAAAAGLDPAAVPTGREDAPRRCQSPRRSPVVSWDGKLTLCPWDTQLQAVVGDIVHGSFTGHWRGPLAGAAALAAARGVPAAPPCAGCGFPWSPNAHA